MKLYDVVQDYQGPKTYETAQGCKSLLRDVDRRRKAAYLNLTQSYTADSRKTRPTVVLDGGRPSSTSPGVPKRRPAV